MLSDNYKKNIYQVKGDVIKQNPGNYFKERAVYLLVDKDLNTIWIWAGNNSKLFQRYMASTWAIKLKAKKNFYNYKYEIVKQGYEPDEFIILFHEINEGRTDLNYPGESRKLSIKSKKISSNEKIRIESKLSGSQKSQINSILSEISEMQMHIKYTMDHIGKRLLRIQSIILD
jgi:hypothetical protein